jgi:hypothetical protein
MSKQKVGAKFTKHALERAKESPLKLASIKKMFKTAYLAPVKKYIETWKFAKYGMEQTTISYYKKELELIYTVSDKTGEIITVTVRDKNTKRVWGKDF